MAVILPDGTPLIHWIDGPAPAPYDPQKAHEYYLRNRKLHPRTKGAAKPPSSLHKVANAHSKKLGEERAYASKRVAELKTKLAELTTELQSRLAKARRREQSKKAPTAADKRKAAQDSKKYRTTHKQKIANQRKQAAKTGVSSMSTDEIKKEIVSIKTKLKAAVAAQRQLLTNG